ncbi:hypothetical protein [Streptomyces californicus]|uniref:hypothetical protein n=1 Tax=Streptomyces californicus TaxID=67351 RepID=UPI0004BFE346|nr:hypothetical protein [Streptomyces californicus]QRV53493.1 hypothetical protein I6J40_04235 [Streptomyces californicus]
MSYDYSKPPTVTTSRDRARLLSEEQRRQAQGAAVAAACVFMIAVIPLQALVLMLVMGAAHGAFAAVPAIGYGTSIMFILGADLVIGFIRRLFRK